MEHDIFFWGFSQNKKFCTRIGVRMTDGRSTVMGGDSQGKEGGLMVCSIGHTDDVVRNIFGDSLRIFPNYHSPVHWYVSPDVPRYLHWQRAENCVFSYIMPDEKLRGGGDGVCRWNICRLKEYMSKMEMSLEV